MHTHLLTKIDASEELGGRLTSLSIGGIPSLLTSEEPFCIGVAGEVSLASRMRNRIRGFSLSSGRGPASSIILLL